MVSTTESISKIFQEVSLGPEPVEYLDWAEKEVKKYNESYCGDSADSMQQVQGGAKKEWNSPPPLNSVAERLEEERDRLVAMLVLLKYTWNNAQTIMTMLINALKYNYMQSHFKPMQSKDNIGKEVTIEIYEDTLMGWYIAAGLSTGCDCTLKVKSSMLPFYKLFCHISSQVLLNQRLHIQADGDRDSTCSPSCPMIIWSDADISSAVNCFTTSLCQFKANVPWAVSHILIEESVFESTVKLIEFKLKALRHGSRFDKHTKLQYADDSDPDSQSLLNRPTHNLKVISVCDRSAVKLCIGWNPKDTDEEQVYCRSNGYITIVPFRNLEELKCAVKELCCTYNMSIWTQAVTSVKASSFNQFSTLWFNCHGLFHPFPSNELFYKCGKVYFRRITSSASLPHDSLDKQHIKDIYFVDDIKMAMSKSISAFQDWNKLNVVTKLPILAKIYQVFLASCNSADFNNVSSGCQIDGIMKNYCDIIAGGLRAKAIISMDHSPSGPILIYFDEPIDQPNILLKLVTVLLLHGNSVTLCYRNVELLSVCHDVLRALSDLCLPPSLLTLVLGQCEGEIISHGFKTILNFNQLIFLSSLSSSDDYLSMTLNGKIKWLL